MGGSNTASVQKQSINLAIEHFTIMKVTIILLVFLVAFTNAASVQKDDDKYCNRLARKCKAGDKDSCVLYKKKCEKDDDKYCDGLATKCKSGDKDACDLYKKKCEKDDDKYCDGLAKKCKSGDKDACELYKKKCGKDDDKYCNGLAKKCKSGGKDACELYKKKCAKEVGYELSKKCQELYDSIPHCDDDYCDAKDDEFDTEACCDCWNMLCYLYPNKCDKCKPNRWC